MAVCVFAESVANLPAFIILFIFKNKKGTYVPFLYFNLYFFSAGS